MGEFTSLYKKNFILWRRNTCGCLCEVISTVVFSLILVLIAYLSDDISKPDTSYVSAGFRPGPIDTTGTGLAFETAHKAQIDYLSTFKKLFGAQPDDTVFKNCNYVLKKDERESFNKGGYVALSPPTNPVVLKLKDLFENVFDFRVKLFDTKKILFDHIKSDDYGGIRADDGKKDQVCLGVTFEENSGSKWKYNVHYNSTGNPTRHDVISFDQDQITPFETEDLDSYKRHLNSGFYYLINFIDTHILKEATTNNNAEINAVLTRVPVKAYKKGQIFANSNNGDISTYVIFSIVIIYLRFVYSILYEKEHRITQNMRNMGMSMTNYYLSWLGYYITVLFALSLVWLAIVKPTFFPDANILLVWCLFFNSGLVFIGLGIFITAFFTRAKPGTLCAIIMYFVLYGTKIGMSSFDSQTVAQNTWFALSPVAGLQKAGGIVTLVQSSYQSFGFSLFSETILNFKYSIWFMITIVEFVVLVVLGIYIDQVWPKETGVRKHPLFCFMKRKKNVSKEHQVVAEKNSFSTQEHFEPVEGALLSQKAQNQTLEIDNLQKIYPNGKKAVQGVNLSIYSNQIFALLGHNGAGKTTTISMMSGLIPISEGSVKVLGYDIFDDAEKVRTIMGICPQTNPIYPKLTVKEHLQLYTQVKKYKGSQKALEDEIDMILQDIDLYDKRNYQAGKLSGGQKRKLCVACAFIGGSKVILLDEPTSGLDVAARRHLWEMLKKYKKDKIIILTTHFMDEADFLGDRIGVMGDGKLLTCGSSMFLKNKFGVGYVLTIVKKEADVVTKTLTDVIQSKIKGAFLEDDISREIKYILPADQLSKFEGLFKVLEEDTGGLGIESFGVSLTTLEDVFLRIAEILGHKAKKDDDKKDDKKTEKVDKKDGKANLDPLDIALEDIRVKSSGKIFSMHFQALLKKRYIYFKRDIKGLVCEIIIPSIVVFLGILITLIQIIREPEGGYLTPQSTGMTKTPVWTVNTAFPTLRNRFNEEGVTLEVVNAATPLDFDKHLQNNYSSERLFGTFLSKNDNAAKSYSYTIFANTTAVHSTHIAQNLINSAILKEAMNDDAGYIKMQFEPMPLTQHIKNFESSVDGFLAVFLISLAYAFIPSSLIMFIVKERENNAKHQQIVSGVSLSAYWFSNFLVDYIKYLIVAFFTFMAILIFDARAFLDGDSLGMTIALLIFFGPALIGFTYLTSFWFKGPSAAQIFTFLFSLLTGFIFMLVILILRIITSTQKLTLNFIEWIVRLFPMFDLCFGLFSATNGRTWRALLKLDEEPTAWSRYGSLWEFIYMILLAVGSFSLIFFIEVKKSKVKKDKETYQKVEDGEKIEEEVIQETKKVQSSENYAIKVENLAKVYTMINDSGKCCSKKKTEDAGGQAKGLITKKAAVKGITFGVKKGEIFSLLGTNGAGKTTTFKILSGEIQPTAGFAKINGMNVATDMKKIRTLIGYCPQFDALLEKMTAREHLEMYAAIKGIPQQYWERLIVESMDKLNLRKYENVQAGTYSGGNKRKLSVAIALLGNPPIVFLDEPSSGMDPEARRFMWSVVNNISNNEKNSSSVILTTHSMEEAEALSTKLAIMVEGSIRCIGAVQSLKNKYGKGFEVEAKLKLPTMEEKKSLLDQGQLTDPKARLNKAQIYETLIKLNLSDLDLEITAHGSGAYIYNEIKNKGFIEADVLMEYCMINKRGNELQAFLKSTFDKVSIIEAYQSFYRFKVEENVSLSRLFGEMEKNKEKMHLNQYSVKQTSIEQIFIKFANERVADK